MLAAYTLLFSIHSVFCRGRLEGTGNGDAAEDTETQRRTRGCSGGHGDTAEDTGMPRWLRTNASEDTEAGEEDTDIDGSAREDLGARRVEEMMGGGVREGWKE